MAPHSGHTAGEGSHAYTRRAALTLASRIAVGAGVGAGAFALSGCASTVNASSDRMHVVATTPILADLAQQIAGDRASVHSLVPAGADPHSYEPSLRDIRDVAYARCALTNGLLLEQRKLTKMVEANLPAGVVSVAVAEKIEQYGGKLEAIVEDASLDSIWLGLRVEEGGQNESAPADSSDAGMRFEVQSVRARTSTDSSNAQLAAFITQTFGAVEMLCDSHARGVNLTREGDTAIRTGDMGSLELPLQAHTHLSWAFSDAGEYAIELSATAVNAPESVRSSRGTLYCAVGRDPQQLVDRLAKEQNVSTTEIKVLSAGHADITARTGDGRLVLRADSSQGAVEYELNRTVVAVPSRTLQEVPAGGSYRFLRSGASEHRGQVYLLAQAVLGKHVHGEIDPHIWHSVPNAKASVQVIRDALISADPEGASEYATRTEQVMKELDALDAQLRQVYGGLPESARNLVTTHDGYRYLASTYGLHIAGFVSASASGEPSIQQRQRLRRTVEDLKVPAIYLDKSTAMRSPVLTELAREAQVRTGVLYSDTLDAQAPHYAQMMLANAHTIALCSGASSGGDSSGASCSEASTS
ncbi:anchored repeat ABC transporter, substrate-binding protein [Rothia mucilaginosa]|uniref:anchored repeat ABC transporter, substrate-binding protein n=1 Tax=Rothia mucilaginosa TaxID=43675 RepID=UPI0028D23406|nr:anchored repeat ABC transporter, substrate-binding protein [Rothia mucilaginosa]